MQFLSDKERYQLKLQHKSEREKRICYRINAILLYDKVWSFKQIAEALLISDDTIRNYTEGTSNLGINPLLFHREILKLQPNFQVVSVYS